MLRTANVPDTSGQSFEWSRFLYKASTGSVKAPEMLDSAFLMFGAAVTGLDYEEVEDDVLLTAFPGLIAAYGSIDPSRIRQESLQHGWLPRFQLVAAAIHPEAHYEARWGCEPASKVELANDACHLLADRWTSAGIAGLLVREDDDRWFNSLHVVTGLLALSLLWPETP